MRLAVDVPAIFSRTVLQEAHHLMPPLCTSSGQLSSQFALYGARASRGAGVCFSRCNQLWSGVYLSPRLSEFRNWLVSVTGMARLSAPRAPLRFFVLIWYSSASGGMARSLVVIQRHLSRLRPLAGRGPIRSAFVAFRGQLITQTMRGGLLNGGTLGFLAN